MSREVCLVLPFPPSINRYWRRAGTHMHISNEGRAFRERAAWAAKAHAGFGSQRVAVEIVVHAPDARRRDLDNLGKATLDALQHGAIYADDSQIDDLRIRRGAMQRGAGSVVVTVRAA